MHGDLDPRLAGHDIGKPFHVVGYGDGLPRVQMALVELEGASGWARLVHKSVEGLRTAILVLRAGSRPLWWSTRYTGTRVCSIRLYMKGVKGQLQPNKTDIQIFEGHRAPQRGMDGSWMALETRAAAEVAAC